MFATIKRTELVISVLKPEPSSLHPHSFRNIKHCFHLLWLKRLPGTGEALEGLWRSVMFSIMALGQYLQIPFPHVTRSHAILSWSWVCMLGVEICILTSKSLVFQTRSFSYFLCNFFWSLLGLHFSFTFSFLVSLFFSLKPYFSLSPSAFPYFYNLSLQRNTTCGGGGAVERPGGLE